MLTVFQKNFDNKKVFDPKNPEDVEIFKQFLKENQWGVKGCPFMLENPYISIPHMIQDKMVKHILKL